MPSFTKYSPLKTDELSKQNLNFNATGKHALNLTAGQIHNVDLKLTDDNLLTGASIIVKDGTFGDKIHLQVVDVDGVLAPSGTVLLQTVTDWGVITDKQDQGSMSVGYPAKIFAGLYLRLVYVSTGQTNPSVIVNYHLHKVLS